MVHVTEALPTRVLVVDDEPAVLKVTAQLLKSLGYEPVTATSGAAALALVQSSSGTFLIAVLDVFLQDVPGPELAEQLRQRTPNIPVVYVSGQVGGVYLNTRHPGERWLPKPFSKSELAVAVQEALAASKKIVKKKAPILLLIDEDPVYLARMQVDFIDRGYRVYTGRDAIEACTMLPDVVGVVNALVINRRLVEPELLAQLTIQNSALVVIVLCTDALVAQPGTLPPGAKFVMRDSGSAELIESVASVLPA